MQQVNSLQHYSRRTVASIYAEGVLSICWHDPTDRLGALCDCRTRALSGSSTMQAARLIAALFAVPEENVKATELSH